jgi:hypothetical protein
MSSQGANHLSPVRLAVGDKGIGHFLLIFDERLEMKDDPQPRDKLQLFKQLDLRGFCFDRGLRSADVRA